MILKARLAAELTRWDGCSHSQEGDQRNSTMRRQKRRHSVHVIGWLLVVLEPQFVPAIYVSYEDPIEYYEGDSLPLIANKLTSNKMLASIDYSRLPLCGGVGSVGSAIRPPRKVDPTSKWKGAVEALHGDSYWEGPNFQLEFGKAVYCGQLCIQDWSDASSNTTVPVADKYQRAIQDGFEYNFQLDFMPVAYKEETESTISTKYYGGIPMGTTQQRYNGNSSQSNTSSNETVFVYNHFNIEILYFKSAMDRYQIFQVKFNPFSINHQLSNDGELVNPISSCMAENSSNTTGQQEHTDWNMISSFPQQPANGKVLFTYDVIWILMPSDSGVDLFKSRWNIFLTMDHAVSGAVEFLGALVAALINVLLWGTLWVWIMRDLSYKPIVSEVEVDEAADNSEEALKEVQMWPLSTRIFFPPAVAPHAFCVCCGTGAHLLLTGFVFVLLFRVGVLNQSMGANILTPSLIIYTSLSPIGGYVTARLHKIFHGEQQTALILSALTATVYPLATVVVLFLVYDVLPEPSAPNYHVVSSTVPFLLVLIVGILPFTGLGGYFGYRAGPLKNFPMSEGTAGYQDLALQSSQQDQHVEDDPKSKRFRKYYIPLIFLCGGVLPVIGCFVGYAYGVAGPILVGYYSDPGSFLIADYGLFATAAGGVATLLYYRQIRQQNYQWWWSSFAVAASSGLYLFFLSISWILFHLGKVYARTLFLYVIWFGHVCTGAGLITGFVGVACCIVLNRTLYSVAMQRAD